jgi:hypothetical protein
MKSYMGDGNTFEIPQDWEAAEKHALVEAAAEGR